MNASVASLRARLLRQRGRYRLVGGRAGVSYSWLSKFATGERGKRPSYELVAKLRAALDELEREQAGKRSVA